MLVKSFLLRSASQSFEWDKISPHLASLRVDSVRVARMNKALVTILLFVGLLLFFTSPFSALASLLVLFLLGAAFLWTLWTVVGVMLGGSDTKRDLP